MSSVVSIFLGLIVIAFLVLIYFIPAMIASERNKKNSEAITVANLFFGWTVWGWFVILIWSLLKD